MVLYKKLFILARNIFLSLKNFFLKLNIMLDKEFKELEMKKELLPFEEQALLNKALKSSDPSDLMKAYGLIVKKRDDDTTNQAFILNPNDTNIGEGYKQHKNNVNPKIYRNMAKVVYARLVISKIIDKIVVYFSPREDVYENGFIIKKRGVLAEKMSKKEIKEANNISDILFDCGSETFDFFQKDNNLEVLLRKTLKDSLVLDKMSVERLRSKTNKLLCFRAIDASTIYYSDYSNLSETEYYTRLRNNELFQYCQVIENEIVEQFREEDVTLVIRNVSTDINDRGYGEGCELQSLVQVVTNLLNADYYNGTYFKTGSNPKGLLLLNGNPSKAQIDEFRREWINQMSGVFNSHKIPILNADKANFINTQNSNKDMEYSSFIDFQQRLLCGLYKVSPYEIGFTSQSSNSLFNYQNKESDYKYSKDTGIKPFVRFVENFINREILRYINPEYIIRAIDAEDYDKKLNAAKTKVSTFATFNEVRKEFNMPEIIGGDIIGNNIYKQNFDTETQKQQQSEQSQKEQDYDPFLDFGDDSEVDEGGDEGGDVENIENEPENKSENQIETE